MTQALTSMKWFRKGIRCGWGSRGEMAHGGAGGQQRKPRLSAGGAGAFPIGLEKPFLMLHRLHSLHRVKRGRQAPLGYSASWGRRWVSASPEWWVLCKGIGVHPHLHSQSWSSRGPSIRGVLGRQQDSCMLYHVGGPD